MHLTGLFPRHICSVMKLTRQIIILAVLFVGVHTQDRCLDCTPQGKPNMKCAILNTKACNARPPAIFHASKSGYYPGSPRDLKVDTYLKYNPSDEISYPVVNISFKGPDDASLLYVKGFEVTLTIMSGQSAGRLALCRLFDLSEANITNDDVVSSSQTEFSYKGCFNRLQEKTTYWVRVRSLPEPTTTSSSAKDAAVFIDTPVPTASVIDRGNSANWSFFIQTVIDNNQVHVSFSKPPDAFRFTTFRVSLIRYTTNEDGEQFPKLVTEKEVLTSPVVFKVQCPGLYGVWVEPIDTFLLNKKKCLCKLDGQCVSMCLISRTRSPINITKGSPSCPGAVLPTSTASTTKNPDTGPFTRRPALEVILGVSIPVTCGLIAVFVLVFVLCRRRCKSGEAPTFRPLIDPSKNHFNPDYRLSSSTSERTQRTGMPPASFPKPVPLSMLSVTKKTLLLLYHADNPAHKNVVFLFADFLTYHCSMEVILHDRCTIEIGSKGKDNWVVEKFETVDWIVIINSTGAFETLRKNSDLIQTEAHILDDMFSCAITMLDRFSDKVKNNCISVFFPYTDKKKLIRQFTPKGIHYELMTNIEPFFLRVHGVEKYDTRGNEIVCKLANINEYHCTDLGKKLKESIDMIVTCGDCEGCPIFMQGDPKQESIDIATNVDPDQCECLPLELADQQKCLDSGVESGITNPPFGSRENMNLITVFYDDWRDDAGDFDGTLADPDAWSSESIGSLAQAEFEQFNRDCPLDGPAAARAQFQQECNDIHADLVNNRNQD